jgi:hypothetical protein
VGVLPAAKATPPRALVSFKSLEPLNPGNFTDPSLNWKLNQSVPDYIFYYKITGGPEPVNWANVTIEETGDTFGLLTGEGYEYCGCPLSAGDYSVTVEAANNATSPIGYEIAFYLVPQPPVKFNGHIPANSLLGFSDFGVLFPGGNNTLILAATSGSYEFSIDGGSQQTVSQRTELNPTFTNHLHLLNVTATPGQDVTWSVEIKGIPKLDVRILTLPTAHCPPVELNSSCPMGASVTASDGSSPNVTYLWTDNGAGGAFNSTAGRVVAWTPPNTRGVFDLTVNASAPGYLSASDSLSVEVVPEFPSTTVPLVLTLAFTIILFARRGRSKPTACAQTRPPG